MPLFLSALGTTEVYTRPIIANDVIAEEIALEAPKIAYTESLEEKIARIASNHKIEYQTLYNLVESESQLGQQRVGDNGKSCGVVHFHQDFYPEEFSRCDDDEYILNRAAEMLANGEDWKFTPCSCVSFAKAMGAKLPKGSANDLFPNTSEFPRVGGVLILKYWNPDRHHVAYIEAIKEDGYHIVEGNFERCKITKRVIPFNSKNIMGAYKAEE